jgi:hypothetical protein
MLDAQGRLIYIGDRVRFSGGITGTVVFSLDTDEFSPEFPKQDWNYLGSGIMVRTDEAGLVYLKEGSADLAIVDAPA